MGIIDLQRSLRRLGKIRMGEQVAAGNGRTRPAKLEHWRITSPSVELLNAAAVIYGGTPQPWDNPATGQEYELRTTTDTLRVIVPPGDHAFSQWYELWSAGGCQRRCDGATEQLSDAPCACPADHEERAAAATAGKACKVTTRLSVMLPDVPDIGIWMLESHGYYAAVELAGAEEILRMAAGAGRMIPASLRIDQRSVKRAGETRRYAVPVLELVGVTAGMLMAGEVPGASLAAPTTTAAALIPAPPPGGWQTATPTPAIVTTTRPPEPPLPGDAEPMDAFDVAAFKGAILQLPEPLAVRCRVELAERGWVRPGDIGAEEVEAARALVRSFEPASQAQMKKLHAAGKSIGLDHEDLHGYAAVTLDRPVSSLTELTKGEVTRLIDAAVAEATQQKEDA